MELEKIEKLIKLLKEHELAELEYKDDDFKICLKLNAPTFVAPAFSSPGTAPLGTASHATQVHNDNNTASPSASHAANKKFIHSPFVGTFYEAPAPDADPFVKKGSQVKKGDILCIIEAMKIMNEIEAEQDCVIKEVLVKNGQAVEFNQPLFEIE